MSDFEKWFAAQDFYTNMRFIHGDALFHKDSDVYRILPVQMTYLAWSEQRQRSKDEFVSITQEWHTKGWNNRQEEIDDLKAQLNNMESCYIKIKQINNAQSEIIQSHVAGRIELQKRIDKAISKWIAITSIVTTQRNGLPDEFYQKLDQLHDVLTGFDEALRGEHD